MIDLILIYDLLTMKHTAILEENLELSLLSWYEIER